MLCLPRHTHTHQATAATPELANMLVQTARDCVELFMALIPVKFASVIANAPRMAAVFLNDCCYIAHNTALITHAHRQQLIAVDETFASCIGLVDLVPRLRALGEEPFTKHVTELKTLLETLVSKVNIQTVISSESGHALQSSHLI
jgi:hypothetical protein